MFSAVWEYFGSQECVEGLKSERLIALNWWNDDPDEARHNKELKVELNGT